jgi:hypothetical protein
MNFSSCCHQNLNNQITKIYTRITVTRSLMINWVVTLISPIPKEESTEEVEGLDKRALCFRDFKYNSQST